MNDIYTLGRHVYIDFENPDSRNKYFEQYHNLMRQNIIDIQIVNVSDTFNFQVIPRLTLIHFDVSIRTTNISFRTFQMIW